ncbi:TonB-dependent receptor plug domain-containing protein, partial [candidate division WOR-3 bacterium]|nr:TonB-dependent receptor plug domain-containing protein [candidate division WOR-3 bacterium]MBD3364499.1 TonB-dependent receptor plug domain-containing protein [candidate division WOR-3 bacterium]
MAIIISLLGATVHGRVFDAQTGEPLFGCNVYLEVTEMGAPTEKNGYYRITDVPPGSYTIVFSMIGYGAEEKSVEVAGDKVRIDAELSSAAVDVEGVVITSRRVEFEEEVTASAYRIDKEDLLRSPALLESDLFRTLLSLPGVTFVSDFTSALYVRGGSPDQNLILLDNIVLYNPFHFGGFLSTFMIDAVDNVEFLTGGFPARYGNRLSSVLDVTSSTPDDLGAYLSTSLLATEGAVWGGTDKIAGILTARRTYFDKVIPVFFDFEFPYYFCDIHAAGSWHPAEKTRVEGTFFFTRDILDMGNQDIPIEFGWGNQLATVRLIQGMGERWRHRTWLGWSRYTAHLALADFLDESDTIEDYTVRTSFIRDCEMSSLEFGAEASYMKFIYKTDAEPFATYDIDGRPVYGSVYTTWKWKPNSLFLFQAGARFSLYNAVYPDTIRDSLTEQVTGIDTLVLLEPEPQLRLSAKYFITADDAVNLAVGNFYQNLAMVLPEGGRIPTNFWIPVFGRFEPQHAAHFIAGYEHLFQDGSRIRIEPYYKHYFNLLAFNEEVDIADVDENIFSSGAGRAYGADFSIDKMTGRLTGWISYSLAFSRFIADTAEFYTSFDRRHTLNLVGTYDLGRQWFVNAKFTIATGMPYAGTLGRYRVWYWDPLYQGWKYQWFTIEADRNSLRFPAYHRLDIGASKKWIFDWCELTVRADVVNVYNHKNVLLYYYDMG